MLKAWKLSSRNVPDWFFHRSRFKWLHHVFFPLFSAQTVASCEHHVVGIMLNAIFISQVLPNKSLHHVSVGGNYAECFCYSWKFPPSISPTNRCIMWAPRGWVASSPKLESNDKAVKQTRRQIICFLRFNWNQRQKKYLESNDKETVERGVEAANKINFPFQRK